jgi:arabinogalactan oligomer/maltooligosaccharide transport system permease protein
MQLEVSVGTIDAGDRTAPRRLLRDEKPLYDRGQRLATAAQTNKEEQGGRKDEIEVEKIDSPQGPRLSVAMLLESGDTVELITPPLPPRLGAPYDAALIPLAAGLVLIGAAAFALGQRKALLAVVALAALLGAEFWVVRANLLGVRQAVRASATAIDATAQAGKAVITAAAAQAGVTLPPLNPGSWDVDGARHARGLLTPAGDLDKAVAAAAEANVLWELRRALYTASGLSVALLLLAGFGALSTLFSTLSKNRQAYLYIAPAIIGMLALVFYPFSYGITLSFTDSNIYNTGKPISDIWVGLKNYGAILGDFQIAKPVDGGFAINYLNFYWTLLFTIIWTVTNVVLGVTSGLFLALILNTRALAFRPIYRVLLILPWAMPNYITALIWKGMFHQQFGVINHVLQMFGLHAVNWFDHPFTSFLTALATNGWLSFPFMMVVSLGALQSIPSDLYEAARVDGATRWQSFLAITLPSLKPALVPAVILSVVWTFNMFNIIYLVTGGEPAGATEILVTQAYKFAFEKYRYGYAAAYSTVIFGILLVYGSIQNRLSKATEA